MKQSPNKNYWLLTSEYPPEFGGGIATYCFQNARMLSANGFNVTVFAPSTQKHTSETFENNFRVIRFEQKKISSYLGYETEQSYQFAQTLKTYMEKEGVPCILESQEYRGIAYFTLLYKHLNYEYFKNLKVLLTLHAPAFLYFEYNRVPVYRLPYFWIGEMEKWCIKAADELNCPGSFLKDKLQHYFRPALEKQITVLPYPFESQNIGINLSEEIRDNWYFFGKMTPQKGIIPLLDTYKKLWNEGWEHSLNVIGGGEHFYHPENQLMIDFVKSKFSKEINSHKLKLLGNLSPKEWAEETKKGGVVIIPSIVDNYPFTVLESMSNGQVVLASMQGGQNEIIVHGENGFLFDHSIEGDLENKIQHIKGLPLSIIETVRRNAIISILQRHNYNTVYEAKSLLLQNLLQKETISLHFPFLRPQPLSASVNTNKSKVERLLSIIIPYFNMGKTIEETLKSVFEIRYKSYEVILINDGSDDQYSTSTIIALQEKYPFRLITQRNCGLARTRNLGLQEAGGEFIAFIDADDKIDPLFYKKAIQLMEAKKNIHFVGSWVRYFEGSNGIWPSFTPEFPYLLYYNMACSGGLIFRKTAFEVAGKNDPKLEYGLEDWDSIISLKSHGYNGVILPEPLYHYRIRKHSMARSFTPEKILYSMNYITQKHDKLYKDYAFDIIGLQNANGVGYKRDNPTLDYTKQQSLPSWIPFKGILLTTIRKNQFIKKVAYKIYNTIKN